VSAFNPCNPALDVAVCVESNNHSSSVSLIDPTDISILISSWLASKLASLCDFIFQESLLKNTEATSFLIFRHELKVFCSIITHTGAYLDKERLEIRESFAQDVSNRLRGFVLYLTSLDINAHFKAWSVGGEILSSALCSKICIGNGLWLLNVLRNIMVGFNAVVDKPKGDSRDEFLVPLMQSLSALLTYTVWQRACESSYNLIPACLASLPSRNVPSFAPSLIYLLRRTWQHRAVLLRSKNPSSRKFLPSTASTKSLQTEDSSKIFSSEISSKDSLIITTTKLRWETEAFDFALFMFVEGIKYRGINREIRQEVRMNACWALHYCLLPLNRQTLVELLNPSTLQNFIPKLQHIMASPVDIDDNGNNSSSNVWSSYRLIACKLLDVWTVGRDEELTELTDSQPFVSIKSSSSDAENEKLPSTYCFRQQIQ